MPGAAVTYIIPPMSTARHPWRLLSIGDSAMTLAVSKTTVRRWIERGLLPSLKMGGRRLIDSRDLDDAVDRAKHLTPTMERCRSQGAVYAGASDAHRA
jgi:excisionase family DNA binding protein